MTLLHHHAILGTPFIEDTYSIHLNGSTGYLLSPVTNDYLFSNDVDTNYPCSLSLWFKADVADIAVVQILLGINDPANKNGLMIQRSAAEKMSTRAYDTDGANNLNRLGADGETRDTNWHLFVLTYSGAKLVTGLLNYLDKIPVTGTSSGSMPHALNADANAVLIVGAQKINGAAAGYFHDGYLKQIVIWNKVLSLNEIKEIYGMRSWNLANHSCYSNIMGWYRFENNALDSKNGHDLTPYGGLAYENVIPTLAQYSNIVCDGNSLTLGTFNNPGGKSYPTLLSEQAFLVTNKCNVTNKGVNSQTTVQMSADYATDILPCKLGGITYNYLIVWEVTNDSYYCSSDADCYTHFVTYCQTARANGWKVIALTCLPRKSAKNGCGDLAAMNASLNAINAMILAGWSTFADYLVDVRSDSRLTDYDNATYYAADGIHLIEAGYAVIVELIMNLNIFV